RHPVATAPAPWLSPAAPTTQQPSRKPSLLPDPPPSRRPPMRRPQGSIAPPLWHERRPALAPHRASGLRLWRHSPLRPAAACRPASGLASLAVFVDALACADFASAVALRSCRCRGEPGVRGTSLGADRPQRTAGGLSLTGGVANASCRRRGSGLNRAGCSI